MLGRGPLGTRSNTVFGRSSLPYIGPLSKSVKLREGWSVFVIDGTSQMIHAVVLEFCDSKTIVLKI